MGTFLLYYCVRQLAPVPRLFASNAIPEPFATFSTRELQADLSPTHQASVLGTGRRSLALNVSARLHVHRTPSHVWAMALEVRLSHKPPSIVQPELMETETLVVGENMQRGGSHYCVDNDK